MTSPDSPIMLNPHNMLMPYGNWAAVDLTHTELVNLTAIHLLVARIMYKSGGKQDQRQVQDQNDKRKQAAKDARRKHRIKAKRKGRVPKEAGASQRQRAGPAVQVLIDQEWVTVPEPPPNVGG